MNARRLIVNADDYGLTPGVDHGIEAAAAAGAVTSVSVMGTHAKPTAVAALAARHPGLSIGVHVNLTTDRPLLLPCEVRSLVDGDGEFLPLRALTRRALAGRVRTREVAAEVAAQLAAVAGAGVTLDHVDSHEHVHLLPGVTAGVLAAARAAGVRRMRTHLPRLLPARGVVGAAGYYAGHPRRALTHAVKAALAARLRIAGMATPDGMVGGALLLRAARGGPLGEWEAVCRALPAGTWELVVHPADVTIDTPADVARLGDLVARRGAELEALVSPAFVRMVRAHGVSLASFAAVGARETPARQERYVAGRA